jgi:hypothetical protein
MTTVYRVMVMIAAGVILVKGWQHYGPSTERVKTLAVAAMDKARSALTDSPSATEFVAPQEDPRTMPTPAVANATPFAPAAPQLVPLANSGPNTLYGIGDASVATHEPLADETRDGVAALLAKLQEIGAADARVGPWGASGQFYRCCCQAKLAESSPMARHFEAVAEEPLAAVQQVVAKVEAWQSQHKSLLR